MEKFILCPECQGTGSIMTAELRPRGHTEVWHTCELCQGDGEIPEDEYIIMKLTGEV